MELMVGGLGLVMLAVCGGLSAFARPYQPRPRLMRPSPRFGLKSLFLITTLCAGLCACLPTAHVFADAAALAACWTICGLIGGLDGAACRGIGNWRGAAFAGALGGAVGGMIFAAAIVTLARPSFALAGNLRHAWPQVACLVIWGLCLGTLIGFVVGACKSIDRRAILAWSQSGTATPAAVSGLRGRRVRRGSLNGNHQSLVVAAVASVLIHFAVIHSPPLSWPGSASIGEAVETDTELVLDAVSVPSLRQPAVHIAVLEEAGATDSVPTTEPSTLTAQVTAPSGQDLLRAARQRTGADAPVCLDGYCPVQLSQHRRWMKGDAALTSVYQGRTYLFASEQAKGEFLERPETFAAALSGYDPVLLIDENRLEPGKREHGVWYRQLQVYLFSSEATLKKFSEDPAAYVSAVQQLETTPAETTRQTSAKPIVDDVSTFNDESRPSPAEVRVDLIELNHFQDKTGKASFEQLLFWSIYPDGKLHIRDWRLVKNPGMLPKKEGEVWICQWIESRRGSDRTAEFRVEAPAYRETTSASDPELLDRVEVERADRIPLWNQ